MTPFKEKYAFQLCAAVKNSVSKSQHKEHPNCGAKAVRTTAIRHIPGKDIQIDV
jgi:hypothetical protein